MAATRAHFPGLPRMILAQAVIRYDAQQIEPLAAVGHLEPDAAGTVDR